MPEPARPSSDGARRDARALSLVILFGMLAGVASMLAARSRWWLLPPATAEGAEVDRLFYTTLAVTGLVFILVHVLLALLLWQGARRGRAVYLREHTALELSYTLAPAAILVTLIAMGGVVWARVHAPAPPDALAVEARAEQFGWVFRYPGADGRFGRVDPAAINARTNPLGLAPDDPAAADDIVVRELHLVVDRPVRLRLRSKDVLHSFFIPQFRVKQDAVPGMTIDVAFRPTRAGTYELACAELCGVGHYIMRGKVVVETAAAFEAWLAGQRPAAP
jgi:cytochrome c oxidase subunit 2